MHKFIRNFTFSPSHSHWLVSKEIMTIENDEKLKSDSKKLYDATEYLLKKAKELGADAADCTCDLGQNLEVSVRMGALENVARAENLGAGLRVMIGKRQAGATTSSFSKDALDELADRVVKMARLATDDPYCGLADSSEICKSPQDLKLYDATIPDVAWLEQQALEAENAAMAIDKITNIAGCGASWDYHYKVYGATNGFIGGYGSTDWGLYVAPMAQDGDCRERDYDMSAERFLSKLKPAAQIGKIAGERAAKRLNPRKIASTNAPVVIEPRVAKSIIGMMLGAISGSSVARGISFLKDSLGKEIFAPNINIVDDPNIIGGHGSRPFDGEGLNVSKQSIIKNGVLNQWLLNTSAAKQLGLKSTGNASFAQGGPHGITISNLIVEPSDKSQADLIKMANNGIFVAEAMAPSFNPNNGDYSVGISGFMIENGILTFPISEITIACNLFELYKNLVIANDLEHKGTIDCPSILVPNMIIAGE